MRKTPRFDQDFQKDIQMLKVNRNTPIEFHGSYGTKEWDSLITDIDLKTNVYYNEKLLDVLSRILSRTLYNDKLDFLTLAIGNRKEFSYPWKLNDDGSCSFDIDKAKSWFTKFRKKNLIPKNIETQIEDILYSNNISIGDIVKIQFLLVPYAEIDWTLDDIRRKTKVIDGHKYSLIELMKNEVPVLEFVYTPDKKRYVHVEYALIDRRFRDKQKMGVYNIFNAFYDDNKYRTLKYLRWKIKPEYRKEYFDLFKNIEKYRYIRSQLDLYETLVAIGSIPSATSSVKNNIDKMIKGRNYADATEELNEIVNNIIEESISYFSDEKKIKRRYKAEVRKIFSLGKLSRNRFTDQELRNRNRLGIKCPFFMVDMDDYDFLHALSMRLMLDPDEVVECVYKTAEKYNISLRQTIDTFKPKNLYSLAISGSKLLLRDNNGKTLRQESKTPKNLKRLQYQIFMYE